MTRLRLTEREINSFNDSCDVLAILLNQKSIKVVIQDAYSGKFSTDIIKKSLRNIYKVQKKVNGSIKENGSKEGVIKKEAFFTKQVRSTESSRALAEITEKISGLKLRYPQDESSCHTDVRSMIFAYINYKELRNEVGVRISGQLRKLAPNSFEDMTYIPRSDKKTIPMACKEILGQ